jgi:hypothetical protein
VSMLYNEDQLSLGESPESAVREQEVGVWWPPDYEDLSQEAEERPLLEEVTRQSSEDRDWEH